MITTLLVEKLQDVGMRLDHYLVYNLIKYSRSHIQSFIRSGHIRVNGKKVKTGYSLELEDLIQIEMPGDGLITKKLVPENLDLNINPSITSIHTFYIAIITVYWIYIQSRPKTV